MTLMHRRRHRDAFRIQEAGMEVIGVAGAGLCGELRSV